MKPIIRSAIAPLLLSMLVACADSSQQAELSDGAAAEDIAVDAAGEVQLQEMEKVAGAAAPAAFGPFGVQRAAVGSGGSDAARPAAPAPLQSAEAAAGAMLIRTGESRMEVDTLARAIDAVERSAAAVDGWIAESSISMGEHQHRSARLVVRVPSDRWDELVRGLRTIGEPRHLSTSTQDVGEQFVDLNAQLANAQRVEARYLELLRTRTGSLEDLLAVERELSRVRERIESLQGRLRYLGERVAVSTMVVHLDQRTDLLAVDPGPDPLREALRAAWLNFLAVITGTIALLGGLIPVVVPVAAIAWWWRRRRSRRETAAATA